MAKIPEVYNVGNPKDLDQEKLAMILVDIYRILAVAVNRKPDVYQRESDGQVLDTALYNGDLNINTITQKVEMLTKHVTTSTVNWKQLS
jgi:hypothetical protein